MPFTTTLLAAFTVADVIHIKGCEVETSAIYEEAGKTFCRFECDDTDYYLPANQEVEFDDFGGTSAVTYSTPESNESDAETVALNFSVTAPLRASDLAEGRGH